MSLERKQLQRVDVVGVAADLIFASRLTAAARAAGVTLALARDAGELPEKVRVHAPRLVLVDLDPRAGDAPAAIRAIAAGDGSPRIVAFASHVDAAAIRAARDAGASDVLARSAFVKRLPALLVAE